MTQNPFFSIVITTYNRADLLPIAIKSVINQLENSWELIIINDGSSDDYTEIEEITKTDERIRYYYKENEERSIARNYGIKKAKGEYICFLDDDDYYLENHLTTFKRVIDKSNIYEFIFSGVYRSNAGSLEKKPLIGEYHNKEELIEKIIHQHVWTCTVCIKRTILLKIQFVPTFNIWEDINLFLKIIARYNAVEIPEYTSVVVNHDNRSTIKTFEIYDKKKLRPYFISIKNLFDDKCFSQYFTKKQKKKFLSEIYINYIKNSFWHKNYKSTVFFVNGLLKTSIKEVFTLEILMMFLSSILFIIIPSLQKYHNGIQNR